jgi:hypothetical protein
MAKPAPLLPLMIPDTPAERVPIAQTDQDGALCRWIKGMVRIEQRQCF